MVVVYWSWNGESCPEIKYFSLFLEQLCFSTYPRKGTETGRHSHHTSLSDIFQLIPARGRKPKLRLRLARDLFISTYPRKGTETFQSLRGDAFLRISTYPRKTLSGAARQLSRRESFSSCHLPCTKLPLSGELARRKP